MSKKLLRNFLFYLVLSATCQLSYAEEFTVQSSPNIILLLVDDAKATDVDFMPNLQERVVQEGLLFDRAYVTNSICCPSRASILVGRYVHNHGVISNRAPEGGFSAFYTNGLEQDTMAMKLNNLGYRTGLVGKYLNGYGKGEFDTYVPPGWNDWHALAQGQDYYEYLMNHNGTVVFHGDQPEDYHTDVMRTHAIDFIDQVGEDQRPFFLFLSTVAAHSPWIPADRHRDEFEGFLAPRPPSFNEVDVSDKPQWVRNQSIMDQTTIDNIDKNYRNRLRTLLAVDDMIADLIQTLEQNEILENTYLFFLTDHGWHDGEHRLADRKGTAYEEAIRIPLMIRGPGVAAGVTSKAIVSTIDLLPTFVDLAIGRAPLDVDGRSLVPILATGQTNNWRKRLLVEFLPETGYVPRYQALRTENYSFVHYIDTGEEELYKMTNDPYQLRSTHAEVAPSVLDLLREQLDSLVNCAGHSCRDADK